LVCGGGPIITACIPILLSFYLSISFIGVGFLQ
jgi:hypothetical protein